MRFQYNRALQDKVKVQKQVKVPQWLTVAADGAGDTVYELVSVVYHSGPRAHSGHYTADCWDDDRGKWWAFDDDNVTEVCACLCLCLCCCVCACLCACVFV